MDFMAAFEVGPQKIDIAVMLAYAPEAAKKLIAQVKNEFSCRELWTTEFSLLMGHRHPGSRLCHHRLISIRTTLIVINSYRNIL